MLANYAPILIFLVIAGAISIVLLGLGFVLGSGSAGSLFGSAGAANFLSRSTAALAAVFFATSMGLTYFTASP